MKHTTFKEFMEEFTIPFSTCVNPEISNQTVSFILRMPGVEHNSGYMLLGKGTLLWGTNPAGRVMLPIKTTGWLSLAVGCESQTEEGLRAVAPSLVFERFGKDPDSFMLEGASPHPYYWCAFVDNNQGYHHDEA